jgi:oxalate decarboxylase/phosphoglucose isomerase-like protein (cupin superfamily)
MGAQKVVATPGSFVIIPSGTVHQSSNAGDEPAHVLIFFTPAGMAEFFTEAAERRIPIQEPPTDPQVQAALDDFCQRHSFIFADFPAGG